uniref:Uncharacterized protein n=1 Tax=uncultured prokaryote TaxID=198431 RepID=A0A0H5Q5I7_9ZZZZ|nr:hypothetical protein [uncultured prokaryote]
MTYAPHALLRFGGRWFDTEEWSCSLRLITDDNSNTVALWVAALTELEPGTPTELSEDIRGFVEAWFLRAGSGIANVARLDYVSLNAIGPDGLYADGGNPHTYEYAPGEAPTGPVAATALPQVTICVSLRTAQTRGAGTHGRFYPPTTIQTSATGRVGSTVAEGMAASAATLLEDIGGIQEIALAGNPRVAVVSDIGSPGPARIVTRVLVGNVFDTQRRRRAQLEEVYVTEPVVTGP